MKWIRRLIKGALIVGIPTISIYLVLAIGYYAPWLVFSFIAAIFFVFVGSEWERMHEADK